MASTTFSGPIKAGTISNTTGTTVGDDVKNTGHVLMVQSFHISNSDTTDTSIRVHAKITEKQSYIAGFIDNVLVKEFNPGSSVIRGDDNDKYFYFYFVIPNLQKGIEYKFRLEVINLNGNIDISNEIYFKL